MFIHLELESGPLTFKRRACNSCTSTILPTGKFLIVYISLC